ncbi:MAG: GlsB/YeaQ/YmgE family stress response membrane protein [Chloroflexi bacterium]|nr:GlsB/YeaQ/YmgE family stress response membrane protein [Chloroflexota bacterium]
MLWWLVIGLIAGVLASAITRSRNGIIMDVILGIVGAFVGGFLLSLLNISTAGVIGTIIAATIGAIVLIVIARALSGSRRRVF